MDESTRRALRTAGRRAAQAAGGSDGSPGGHAPDPDDDRALPRPDPSASRAARPPRTGAADPGPRPRSDPHPPSRAAHPRHPHGRIVGGRGGRKLRTRTLAELQPLVRKGAYRIGSHAARHAACEGFTERDIVATVLTGRELMRYTQDERLLVLGYLPVGATVRIPLHVVLEYRKPRWVDVVTAFIPSDPHRVISRGRLAEALRYDRHAPEARLVGPGSP